MKKYDEEFKKLSVKDELSNLKTTQKYLDGELMNPVAFLEAEKKAENLNKAIETMLTTFSTMNKSVLDIMATYQDKINEAVAESLKKNAIGQANEQTIGLLVEDLKGSMIGKVSEAVRELPYYDEATIEKLHLGDADKQYLKNINRFAEKFSQKNKIYISHLFYIF